MHQARSQAYKGATNPGKQEHIRGYGHHDFSGGAHKHAKAEVLLPPDDDAHHAARNHKRTCYERINHVRQLVISGCRTEKTDERVRGKRHTRNSRPLCPFARESKRERAQRGIFPLSAKIVRIRSLECSSPSRSVIACRALVRKIIDTLISKRTDRKFPI